MTEPTFLKKSVGVTLDGFLALATDQRAGAVRVAFPDLNVFFDDGAALEERDAPRRTRELAASLCAAIAELGEADAARRTLRERIVTDAFLRSEADRDQNVYLGSLFTRRLTRAVPDLIFQPVNAAEAACALRWAREHGVPVALRGAASTAMGGSVPNDGGLTLDASRLDGIDVDAADGVCVVGAGVRLRAVHARLAQEGLALKTYPSNLGGTLAGWFVTGGIGMNAFGRGRALDGVRAADVLLPSGEHVRFHDDGRLDVPDGARRKTLAAAEAPAWFRERETEPIALADLAGSEGIFGLLLHLTVRIEPRCEIGAFLLSFETEADALAATEWVRSGARHRFPPPANLKLLSGSHLHHTREVWRDEDARGWRARPGALATDESLPWTRIAGPRELGAEISPDREHAGAYLFVDFLGLDAARTFASALGECPGRPIALDDESVRFARERFRPQQTKRLGPGLLAAEILMPAAEVPRFLPRAASLVRNAGNDLDAEVYYVGDGGALVIAAYLIDHRSGAYAVDLALAPALLDLAMRDHHGKPYVLGRWQAAYAGRKFGADGLARRARVKRALDPDALVNRGVLLGLRLRGVGGALLAAAFVPGVAVARAVCATPALAWAARAARTALRALPGPARGRGEPARVAAPADPPSVRAIHCVNCGECNSVCPIFHESKVRLPQMLTHLGEALHGGEPIGRTGGTLLDLCMRCGNCEEVCQAGIPHLALYGQMERADAAGSDAAGGRDADGRNADRTERHVALLATLRSSGRYRDFLDVRDGGYLKRAPVALPGLTRYLVLRAENDAGPAATCIHCGACVTVCPTHANREFEGDDPRWITTIQNRCIGCGTCVEVCPANHANGGQTLRVVDAPTGDLFDALAEFERMETT